MIVDDGLSPEQRRQLLNSMKRYGEVMAAYSEQASAAIAKATKIEYPRIPRIKLPKLPDLSVSIKGVERLTEGFPSNLLEGPLGDIDDFAEIAQDDGIPISWVPNRTILNLLRAAESTTDRYKVLLEHRDVILDECDSLFDRRSRRWSQEALEAVHAAQAGHHGSAQSHAANLIDTIVLDVFMDPATRNPSAPRKKAKKRAATPLDDEQSLLLYAEHVAVLPVTKALTDWYPGDPPPDHFSRHATAHAVGHLDVFNTEFSLIAVMLAASLARQFGS